MAITIICPNLKCRAMLQVAEKTRGKKVRCSQCATLFLIPLKKSDEPAQPAPASKQPDASS
ncbi:MAG: hypothetical protein ACE5GE_02165 [Phycisphaerae bacterium]